MLKYRRIAAARATLAGHRMPAEVNPSRSSEEYTHDHLLGQAINGDDGDRAAKIIQDALGIESNDVANYLFPKT
jgi:hypothetical protein